MPTKTQAWVVEKLGGPFVLHDVTLDDPLDNEVLVEMIASGICHTDETVAKGDLPDGQVPVILGHEGSGKVLKIGANVQRVKPGDLVLLSYAHCEACEACKTGQAYACDTQLALNFEKIRANGQSAVGILDGDAAAASGLKGQRVGGSFFGQSSFARHALVKESSCVVVPEGTDMVLLAPLGCGMQTGAGGVFNAAGLKPHHTILINGLGGVGMGALFAATSIGAKTIIAVDMSEERLKIARELGATHSINPKSVPSDTTLPDEVRRLTGGRGVDRSIESTANGIAAQNAFLSLALGGRMVQIGSSPGKMEIAINDIILGLRSIEACIEGNDTPHRLVPRLVDLYKAGKFPMDRIVAKYPWTEMQRALDDTHSGKVIKPVLVF